jgi:hypothetical protein
MKIEVGTKIKIKSPKILSQLIGRKASQTDMEGIVTEEVWDNGWYANFGGQEVLVFSDEVVVVN